MSSAPLRINLPVGDSAFDGTNAIVIAAQVGNPDIVLITDLHMIVSEETAVYFGDAIDPDEDTIGDIEVLYGPYDFGGKGQGMVLPKNREGHFRIPMAKGLRLWTLTGASVQGTINIARLAQ